MDKLGIQPIQLLTQTFNFILLVFVLKKFLYKPILKMLDERQKKIKEGLEYAEKMKAEMSKSDKKGEEIIEKAKKEARELLSLARKEVKQLENETVSTAEKEAKNIVEKARLEAKKEYEVRVRDLEKDALELASRMVERLFRESLSSKEQRDIISHRLKNISKSA